MWNFFNQQLVDKLDYVYNIIFYSCKKTLREIQQITVPFLFLFVHKQWNLEKRGGRGKLRRFIKRYFIKILFTFSYSNYRELLKLKKSDIHNFPSFNHYETLNLWRQPMKSRRNRHHHCQIFAFE